MNDVEIRQRYDVYCQNMKDYPINSDYEPISFERYKTYLTAQPEPKRCPRCKHKMIKLNTQHLCWNEYCGHSEHI